MKRYVKSVLIALFVIFIVIQFIQPKKNAGEITSDHFINQKDIPSDIKTILKTSCFDCHSNQTTYLWFDKIAPASWLVSSHIKEGKHHLNFSNWGKTDTLDLISDLGDISDVMKDKSMPLTSFTMMHGKARLTQDQRNTIIAWSDSYANNLLKEMKK
ncbi:heme-binding domain-containing protein [Saccharicrinis sp. FJH62]|uniref:heme-binding domain-containing protein n=1 Tax=Saccharicrinis sp. FJH62 TaxID=3344657 RepID=UPI0035D4840D